MILVVPFFLWRLFTTILSVLSPFDATIAPCRLTFSTLWVQFLSLDDDNVANCTSLFISNNGLYRCKYVFVFSSSVSLEVLFSIHIKPMPMIYASANTWDNPFGNDHDFDDNDGVITTNLVKYCGTFPHGECWVQWIYLIQYSEPTLVLFGRSLLYFYPTNPDVIPSTDFVESRIAHHYSGYEFMTEEGRGELAFVCFDPQGNTKLKY